MFPDSLKSLNVSIIGLGVSGVALARVLSRLGCRLLLSDNRNREQLEPVLAQLQGIEFELEAGGQSEAIYRDRDLVVISPGVSIHHPILKAAREAGVAVAGEVEIASRLSSLPFLAVTGTNGKSTTVTLLGKILGEQGLVAGNIGVPLVGQVQDPPSSVRWVVAEVSSFQLESVHEFRPRVAVLTNLTPDHLDRHPSFEEYMSAKARMFANLGEADLAVLPWDEPWGRRFGTMIESGQFPEWLSGFAPPHRQGCPTIWWFSGQQEVSAGVWFDGQAVRAGGELFSWDFPSLAGPHNLANALAATAVAHWLGYSPERIVTGLRGHEPLHFRLEPAGEVAGVRYINDSKATNVASVVAAVNAFPKPLVLIAGGKDKGFDFSELAQAVATRVDQLILIGEAADRLQQAVGQVGFDSIQRAKTLKEAVGIAYRCSKPGGTVLLSPACSSFDMFANAEERGRLFNQFVQELGSEVSV